MADTNLITALSRFSQAEIRNFRKFLKSPYFRCSSILLKLFDLIINYNCMGCLGYDTRKMLFSKLYPGKTFRDSTIRNLISDLNIQLREFLTYENFRNSSGDKKRFFINELLKKNINGEAFLYDKNHPDDSARGDDFMTFFSKMFTESNKFNFAITTGKVNKVDEAREEMQYLDNALKYLYLFYYTQALQFCNTSVIMKQTYDIAGMPCYLKKTEEEFTSGRMDDFIIKGDEHYFIVELYSNLVKMNMDKDNIEYYHNYRSCINKYAAKLSADEISMHIANLTSYCVSKVSSGKSEFNEELFDLIELTLKNNYYKDNKTEHLPHEYFRNYLLHGLRLKKYEWVRNFIDENYIKVHPADRENMKYLGYANLDFSTGNYTEALKNLNNISRDFFAFKLDIKNLTLRIFYELGYTEEALSGIRSYREYLRKDKLINAEKRKRYFSFINLTEKLILFRSGSGNIDIGYVKHRILNHRTAAFKQWLTEKVIQLESRMKKSA